MCISHVFLQMQELFQLRSKEANLMALAIVGPRKMREMEAAAAGAENMVSSFPHSVMFLSVFNSHY